MAEEVTVGAPSAAGPPNLLATVLRMAGHTVWDRLARPVPRRVTDTPCDVNAVTKQWLTAALCAQAGADVEVAAFALGPATSGTTVRRRIGLTYSGETGNLDLPASVFAKSSPTFFNRVTLGLSRTIENEALFYRHIRPLVALEAPRGYHCSYDLASGRSLQLMEDLAATKGARFCSPRDHIDRGRAEDIVGVLAAFHGAFLGASGLSNRFPWLRTYPQWFRDGYETFGLRKFHEKAMVEAADVIPADVRGRAAEVWPAQLRSLVLHEAAPQTLIHGDVHLGNWYITADGRMGLCDWQCVSIGSWARDFAYAVSATLTIEDRRAWEADLLRLYLERVSALAKRTIDYDDAWRLYRQQLPAALLMWTPTLCHSPLMPDMQPREVSMEMIRRITAAMSDLESLDSV